MFKHTISPIGPMMLAFALMLCPMMLSAQQPDVQQIVADIVEDLAEQDEAEQDYSDITNQLLQLAETPIDLNTATADQIRALVFLNDFQLASLLHYRDSLGPVYSIYELMCLPGFNQLDVLRLGPFLKFGNQPSTDSQSLGLSPCRMRSQLALRFRTQLETPAGYTDAYTGSGKYLGNKHSYFMRYSLRAGKHIELGLTGEKDAGEPFFNGTFKTGFDYLGGHITLRDYKRVRTLVVGSFDAGFGEGLTFWSGLSMGKSGSTLGGSKRSMGLRPHASAYEAQYLQGVGINIELSRRLDFIAFGSYRLVDARLSTDTLFADDQAFTSLLESGYHRTASELSARHTLPEVVAGGHVRYNLNNAQLGLTFVHQHVGGKYDRVPAVYELGPRPSSKTALGSNFRLNLRQHSLFGEASIDLSNNGQLAALVGGLFNISNTVQVSLVGRSYAREFNSRYTAGLSEGGNSNEHGIYLGTSLLPTKGWRLSAYIDLFRFPWMRYGIYAPSSGRDLLLLSEHTLTPRVSAQLRLRHKQRAANIAGAVSMGATPVLMRTANSARLQLTCAVSRGLSLKSGLHLNAQSSDSSTSEVGFALTQDVSYRPSRLPMQLSARFAIFDTPSWNSRIYSYESDMLYAFSVPAYYSRGTRMFVLLRYSPLRWADVYVRYAQTYFSQVEELGAGADLVQGNTRSELKLMLRLRF